MKNENSINYYFTKKINLVIKNKILDFLEINTNVSIEQNPDWCLINNSTKKLTYFYATEGDKIVCFCNIIEKRFTVLIHLGPIFETKEILLNSLEVIRNYYLKKGFAQMEVQLGIQTSQSSDDIEYSLYKLLPFTQKFDDSNWSTMIIYLNQDIETIFSQFKRNHKGSIKKAIKENLTVKVINSSNEIRDFANIYDKMYQSRKLKKNFIDTFDIFSRLNKMFIDNNRGVMIGVFNANEKMIGGVVFGICNKEMYYKYGASDPEFRKLPVLHLAIYEGVKLAKEKGLQMFNLGGFNHFVKENNQVYAINFFKKSFNGEFIYYPKKMYFKLNKTKFLMYNIIRTFYYWNK